MIVMSVALATEIAASIVRIVVTMEESGIVRTFKSLRRIIEQGKRCLARKVLREGFLQMLKATTRVHTPSKVNCAHQSTDKYSWCSPCKQKYSEGALRPRFFPKSSTS